MPLILGSQSATAAAGYSIDNSCMFNRADSAKLAITFGSAGDLRKWTLSFWLKRGNITQTQRIMVAGDGSNNNLFGYVANDTLDYLCYTTRTPANQGNLLTNRLFRDPSAWYHYVFVWDTDNATADLRLRMYINGTEETSFSADVNEENADSIWNSAVEHQIAKGWDDQYFDGYIAEAVFTDGQVYAPSDFGEFNSDSPTIWQPTDPSGLTMTGNSFWLDFADSADLGNDVSGNNNDFTSTNLAATDQMTDTSTNNFATGNPLYKQDGTFSEGNLAYTIAASDFDSASSTFGAANGKWYFESKITATASGTTRNAFGICDARDANLVAEDEFGQASGRVGDTIGWTGLAGTQVYKNGSSEYAGTTYTTDDILSCAIDLDNGFVYLRKNAEAWMNSGDPTSGATGTGGVTITTGETYLFGNTAYGGAAFIMNYGNPPYANTSDAADANGYGRFELAPPSGYYAMCTKNLSEFGG